MGDEADDPHWRQLRQEGRLGHRRARYLVETTSTNDLALALATTGEAEAGAAGWAHGASDYPQLVVAERQSQGRGRLRRSWWSPPEGGLYVSFVYRPRLELEELAKLTLVAGVATAVAVERETGLQPGLKWPNDILLAGKKCGGILCETRLISSASPARDDDGQGTLCQPSAGDPAGHGAPAVVVVGIGLNVNTTAAQLPPELQATATSLRLATGRVWQRGMLLAAIADELDALVGRLEAGEFAAILARWRRRDALYGRELAWLTPAGEVVRGVALGPDDDGALRIRDRRGAVHQVLAGDLTVCPDTDKIPRTPGT